MARPLARRRSAAPALPEWIAPQLTQLVETAPEGDHWLHEIKFDGYRMHARLDHGAVRLLTRTGLDWTPKYPAIAKAVAALPATRAYLDGELCGVFPDGITSFGMIQAASDAGNAAGLVYFIFDLLHRDGEDVAAMPLIDRKARLADLLSSVTPPLHYSDYHRGQGPAFHEQACKLSLEGIVSKRADAPYAPGNRGIWLKIKCLYREEFVVVGWTDPEGRRPYIGALLLAYYDPDGKLVYAGRAGTGIDTAELERLWRRLQPLATERMPLDVRPPRSSRFGSPLVLSRVHWVRPELVAEVKFLTWTEEGLLRQVIYQGLREDKPAADVRRPRPKVKAPMCNDFGNNIPYSEYLAAFSQTRIPVKWPSAAPNLEPREDIWPTDRAPVIRRLKDRTNAFSELRWGFPPARPKGAPVINFRSEGRRFPVGRCLVPASHFFEFTGKKSPKAKWKFTKADEDWFCFAGLWRPMAAGGEAFTLLTTEPSPDVAPIHDRQMVVLDRLDWSAWLEHTGNEADLLRALPAGSLKVEQVR